MLEHIEKKRNNRIFRDTAHPIDVCIASVFSEISDWTGLLAEGGRLEKSRELLKDKHILTWHQRCDSSPMDEDRNDTRSSLHHITLLVVLTGNLLPHVLDLI